VALAFFLSGSWAHRVIRDADVPTLSADT
jgi:hypothetical protein